MLSAPAVPRSTGNSAVVSPIVRVALACWSPAALTRTSLYVYATCWSYSSRGDARRPAPGRIRPNRPYSLVVRSAYCDIRQDPTRIRGENLQRLAAQAKRSLGDALQWCRQRQPHMFAGIRSVERAGTGEDAEIGEPGHRLPRIPALGHPQVQAGLRPVDPEAGRLQRGAQQVAAGAVELLLRGDVLVIAQGRHHRLLDR